MDKIPSEITRELPTEYLMEIDDLPPLQRSPAFYSLLVQDDEAMEADLEIAGIIPQYIAQNHPTEPPKAPTKPPRMLRTKSSHNFNEPSNVARDVFNQWSQEKP